MSSTNRGADRHASDYYVTPQKPIHDFLYTLSEDASNQFGWYQRMSSGISILDPCAGGDDRTDMAYPKALRWSGTRSPGLAGDFRPDNGGLAQRQPRRIQRG